MHSCLFLDGRTSVEVKGDKKQNLSELDLIDRQCLITDEYVHNLLVLLCLPLPLAPDMVSCSSSWPHTYHVDEDDPELLISLLPPPRWRNSRHDLPHWVT